MIGSVLSGRCFRFLAAPVIITSIWAESEGYGEAYKLYQESRYRDSLTQIRTLFRTEKITHEIRMLAAANYVRLGEYEQALAHLNYCIRDYPGRSGAREFRIAIYRDRGSWKRAERESRAALSIYPANQEVRWELSLALYHQNRHEASRVQLGKILSEDADHFHAIYLDGLNLFQLADYENAEFRFRQALSLREDVDYRADIYNNLGLTAEVRGNRLLREKKKEAAFRRFAEAEQYYGEALRNRHDHRKALRNQVRLKARNG